MHVNAETRERLLNAFDGPKNELWKNVGTPSEAIVLLRKLWQCTDVVPRYYREEVSIGFTTSGVLPDWTLTKIR